MYPFAIEPTVCISTVWNACERVFIELDDSCAPIHSEDMLVFVGKHHFLAGSRDFLYQTEPNLVKLPQPINQMGLVLYNPCHHIRLALLIRLPSAVLR